MGKEGGKSTRTGAVTRSVRLRQERARAVAPSALWRLLETRSGAWGVLVTVAAALLASILTVWAREQPLAAPGRVADETRVVRRTLEERDRAGEAEARENARSRTPRVYAADVQVLDEIRQSLESLPSAVASAASIDRVDPELRERFGLTPELLGAVQAEARLDGKTWLAGVARVAELLRRRPVLDESTFQREVGQGLHARIRLVFSPTDEALIPRYEVVNLADERQKESAFGAIARDAGFTGANSIIVAHRLMQDQRATFRADDTATAQAQHEAAELEQPLWVRHQGGEVIFRAGETLTPAQVELYAAEVRRFPGLADTSEVWLPRIGMVAVSCAVALAAAGYVALFVPRIRKSPGRITSAAVLLLCALGVACVATALYPGMAALTATAPVVVVAMLLTIVYDPRVALAMGVLLATLACLAVDRSIGTFAVLVAGVGVASWQLRDISERGTLVRGALAAAASMGFATLVAGLIERPVPASLRDIGLDAGLAGAGAVLCGGVTLFILPNVERIFDVATGLTLIELRDPKHPLLRELQVRAPGTYNHSLNVAAIAESAADAIGASSLLTYVGALYHDIGKMNKPEYFIENRVGGGASKHDKLTPALSLLVIVGHVKDGLELSIEFGLPRALRHFIEGHHGTTLVEFFYHRAKQRAIESAEDAEVDDSDASHDAPDEVEYRYTGPRPQTKECAILMVADAVESATRTLPDPTPARIEALVAELANKRLTDGQFDDCELTLRELNAVCESIARSVTSIYHGRISYPGTSRSGRERA